MIWSGLERAIALVAEGTMPVVAIAELLRQELRAARQAVAEYARANGGTPGAGPSHSPPSIRPRLTETEFPEDATVEEIHERLDYLARERDAALGRVRELSRELAQLGQERTGQGLRDGVQPNPSAGLPLTPTTATEPSILAPSSVSGRLPLPSLRPRPAPSAGTYSVGPGKIAEEEVFVAPPSHPATSRR